MAEESQKEEKLSKWGLNTRQQRFVDLLIVGEMTPAECYLEAGYSARSNKGATSCANLLKKHPKIVRAFDAIQAATTFSGAVKTLEEKRTMLAKVMDDECEPLKNRFRAMEIDNKLAGHDAPKKIEHSGGVVCVSVSEEDERI